jgi:hypothetical protein
MYVRFTLVDWSWENLVFGLGRFLSVRVLEEWCWKL